jgi:hypothetical protein
VITYPPIAKPTPATFGKRGRQDALPPPPTKRSPQAPLPATPLLVGAKLQPSTLMAGLIGSLALGSVAYVALAQVSGSPTSASPTSARTTTLSPFAQSFGCITAAMSGKSEAGTCAR